MEQLAEDIDIALQVFGLQAKNDDIGREALAEMPPAQISLPHAISADAEVQHFRADAGCIKFPLEQETPDLIVAYIIAGAERVAEDCDAQRIIKRILAEIAPRAKTGAVDREVAALTRRLRAKSPARPLIVDHDRDVFVGDIPLDLAAQLVDRQVWRL